VARARAENLCQGRRPGRGCCTLGRREIRGRRVNGQSNSGGQAPRRARRATSTRGRFAAWEAEIYLRSGQGALRRGTRGSIQLGVGMPTYDPRRSPIKRKPTSTAELRINLAHLSSDLKHSNAPSSTFHTRFTRQTNSTPPPSVRTRNPRTKEYSHHKRSIRSTYLANIEPAYLDANVCVRAWFKWGGPQG
jgi:hypothetical protein